MSTTDDILELFGNLVEGLSFEARRNELEQIVLGWVSGQLLIDAYLAGLVTPPVIVVERVRTVIKRTARGYPLDISHGNTVYDSDIDGDVETFLDTSPILDMVNYYTVFIEVKVTEDGAPLPGYAEEFWLNSLPVIGVYVDPKWNITSFNTKYRFADTFDFATKFYSENFLPDIYRREDVSQEPTPYPLKRFLQILGTGFEWVRDKNEEHFNANDPLKVDDDLLEALAWNVGWILNKELPLPKQRLEVRRAVRVYKRKGTKAGLIALLEGLSGWTVVITKGWKNILITNLLDSTTIDPTDPVMIASMGTSWDMVDYIFGGDYTNWGIKIYIYATSDWELFNRIQDKIVRVLQMWLPICCTAEIVVLTEGPDEGIVLDVEHVSDDLHLNWLLTNDTGKFTNDLKWRTPIV